VASLLALEYPNGRTADVSVEEEVEAGQELNLYGRRWKVIGHVGRAAGGTRFPTRIDRRLLCRTISE
jgi:hypothetical protein